MRQDSYDERQRIFVNICPAHMYYRWGEWVDPDKDLVHEQERIYRIVYVDMPCTPRKCEACKGCDEKIERSLKS
jgi:hypothetical protein